MLKVINSRFFSIAVALLFIIHGNLLADGLTQNTVEKGFGLRGFVGDAQGMNSPGFSETGNLIYQDSGLTYGLEALYRLNLHVEASFGIFPLYSSYTLGYVPDETDKFSSVAFFLGIYLIEPFGKKWSLLSGAGVGAANGGNIVETYSSGASSTSISVQGAIAARAVLALEYSVTRHISVYLGIEIITADFRTPQSSKYAGSTMDFNQAAGQVGSTFRF